MENSPFQLIHIERILTSTGLTTYLVAQKRIVVSRLLISIHLTDYAFR